MDFVLLLTGNRFTEGEEYVRKDKTRISDVSPHRFFIFSLFFSKIENLRKKLKKKKIDEGRPEIPVLCIYVVLTIRIEKIIIL